MGGFVMPETPGLKQIDRRAVLPKMTYAIYAACAFVALLLLRGKLQADERITLPTAGPNSSDLESVDSYIRAGRTIDAIKLLRQEDGMGLRDAKEEVEKRAREMKRI